MNSRDFGVTLLELLIAITLLAGVVLSFSSIDLFSRFNVASSDRRAQLENEVYFVSEHIARNISRAVGDINDPAAELYTLLGNPCGAQVVVWVDYNQNGRRDPEGIDRRVAYRFCDAPLYQIRYCPQCTNSWCGTCSPGWGAQQNILSKKSNDSRVNWYDVSKNYIGFDIKACFDPDGNPSACGSPDNPTVNMKTRIAMPGISTN